MERNKILPPITLFIVFLLLSGMAKMAESQFRGPPMPSRPLCLSQFALANHACSLLPYGPNPYEPPPPSDDPDDPDEVLYVDSDHHDNSNSGHGNGNGGDHDHHDHGNGDDHGRHRHHVHRHRASREERRRRRHHHHHETPIEEDCCRWLRAVDDQCVCEVLVHLPVFLARPWHRYQVVVDSSCNVTYDCAGRVIGL